MTGDHEIMTSRWRYVCGGGGEGGGVFWLDNYMQCVRLLQNYKRDSVVNEQSV